jgi:hypothetical protein
LNVGIAIVFEETRFVCATKLRGRFPFGPLLVQIGRQILPIVGRRKRWKCAVILEYLDDELKRIHGARAQSK